jgi:lysophospholipase L1-like esterase
MIVACISSVLGAFAQSGGGVCDYPSILVSSTPVMPQKPMNYLQYINKMDGIGVTGDVVLLGDSLTNRWPEELVKPIFGDKKVINLGIEADTTQNVLWRLDDERLRQLKPSMVVLMIGVNNLISGTKGCAIAEATKKIIQTTRKIWPNAYIVHVGMLPYGEEYVKNESERLDANKRIEENSRFFDNYSFIEVDVENFTCGLQSYKQGLLGYWIDMIYERHCDNYQPDNLHFSDAGYQILASFVASAIRSNR